MSRKTFFIRLYGIMAFSILLITTASYGQQYYLHYPGDAFIPKDESSVYFKGAAYCQLWHNDTNDAYYFCPVNFNKPDGSALFIKSLSVRYLDNLTDGYLRVELRRCNIFNSAYHSVAVWASSKTTAIPSEINTTVASITGKKLIDTKKYAYRLIVKFDRDGDLNPGSSLQLLQVRVHYGT